MEYTESMMKKNISDIIRMTAIIAFGAFKERYKQPKFEENSAEDSLYIKLINMIDDGKICEAENVLLDKIQNPDMEGFHLALDIYSYMNEKNDTFLDENNFTRSEIEEGVKYVIRKFGYDIVFS